MEIKEIKAADLNTDEFIKEKTARFLQLLGTELRYTMQHSRSWA